MKKKTKGKVIMPILILLIAVCLLCGTLGYVESKKVDDKDPSKENKKDFKVAYRYYVDGEEVEEMPENEITENPDPDFEGATTKTPSYAFEKYTCTNNVTGEFDEKKWEFKPDLTANTTCRLYFIKGTHEVTFKVSNGKLPEKPEDQKLTVELNKEGNIKITPNDGYKFDKVECTNDTKAEYNSEANEVKVSNVKKDSVCTISFKISDYSVEVRASNGTVTGEAKSANYGENVTFDVTPSDNYKFDTVSCTNNQVATYENGKLTVTGISNDTICTVQFKPVRYNVTLEVTNGSLITGTVPTQTVAEGGTVSFGISPNEGYQLTGATTTCNVANTKIEATSGTVFIYNVTQDLNCRVTLKATN